MTPNQNEINEQLELAQEQVSEESTKYLSLTYEDGVVTTIRWMLGLDDNAPMED